MDRKGKHVEERLIRVTQTDLPTLGEYNKYLKKIWNNGWITNNGELVQELERRLAEYLGVKYVCVVANGTLALQLTLRALDVTGEVVTTPFSYVATVSSAVWEGCRPVFADIDRESWNIDPMEVEKVIGTKTKAIMATHVYGNPCEVEVLGRIAKRKNVPVIYDAAHGFGVRYKDKSLVTYGDASILSFHATKIFHAAEGGAVVVRNKKMLEKVKYLRNFGHRGREKFWGVGINAKMSELHAAMGLSMLPKVKKLIEKQRRLVEEYDLVLESAEIGRPMMRNNTEYNWSYYPILLKSEAVVKRVVRALAETGVEPRRYFYPSLDRLPYVASGRMKVAQDVASRVLCLPLYSRLKLIQVRWIGKVVTKEVGR